MKIQIVDGPSSRACVEFEQLLHDGYFPLARFCVLADVSAEPDRVVEPDGFGRLHLEPYRRSGVLKVRLREMNAEPVACDNGGRAYAQYRFRAILVDSITVAHTHLFEGTALAGIYSPNHPEVSILRSESSPV